VTAAIDVIECRSDFGGGDLLARLAASRSASHVAVRAVDALLSDAAISRLITACDAPLVASASPIPCASAPLREVAVVGLHDALPPAPSLGLLCVDLCVISVAALDSIVLPVIAERASWREALTSVSQRLTNVGWRHVAAPGTALHWRHSPLHPDGVGAGWSDDVVAEMGGDGNEGLSAHKLWVDTQLRPVRVVIDGACLTDSPHNGTQAIVFNIGRSLKHSRPDATIALAVKGEFVAHVSGEMAAHGVEVVSRDEKPGDFDIVYRPYQTLDPSDLVWLADAGRRLIVGQLDMIGFSNPSYHPSPALFLAVRNLQRHLMRSADGVTFISEFARATAFAECPGLERDRTFVVSCGIASHPSEAVEPDHAVSTLQDFLLCLSATFWHKNRAHAIRVFAELCADKGYDGSLVVVGPEPLYGRSIRAEDELILALPPDVARRVVRLGQTDEATKWWLLRKARLVLYPSVVEGFGMIPFEAASVATPSLSYAGSGLLEVMGAESPALVRSWLVGSWVEAAAKILNSSECAAVVVAAVDRAARNHTWEDVAERTWLAIDTTLARARARLAVEEGGYRSHVARPETLGSPSARAVHFANRLFAYARRRFRRSEVGAP
jgi:glycosyltransferase involved in cell wall biosynthesis